MGKEKDILKLTPSELYSKSRELAKKMVDLRMKNDAGQAKAVSEIRNARKDRARVLTALTQKNCKHVKE
ncbi:MAG: 50S ribosomal protein L29 [Opitutales bacterium]|nr:50S ribosomal protein L29 [Opitutales bacterium]